MKNLIGFPQFILNASQLDERYREVRIGNEQTFLLLSVFFSAK